MPSRERKAEYFARLTELLKNNTRLFVVHADHVGSLQFQKIRQQLRGIAEVIMGKNTLMRKVITSYLEENGEDGPYANLLPLVKGNIGFIFVQGDMNDVRKVIDDNIVPAPARAGVEANRDVYVPAGPTGCDPSQTNYFQALNVPTKIAKGQIEIMNDIHIIVKGTRVTAGAASLLKKLNIKPFSFGLIIKHVYNDGSVFAPEVLELGDEDLINKFKVGVNNLAAISLAINYPTLASVPHLLSKAMQRMIAVVAEAGGEYKFAKAEETLAFLADPEAFAKAAAAAAGGGADEEEEKKEEEEEEEEEIATGGMFGGDEDEEW